MNGNAREEGQQIDPESPSWGYGAEDGPAVWGELASAYALCTVGTRQSPIDLVDATPARVPALTFHYRPMALRVANNGRTIEVSSGGDNWIEVGGARYELAQFHFHTPSEHTVNGESLDMEVHLVHRNEAGELAVVGVFVRRGGEHPVLDALVEHLPQSGESLSPSGARVDASELLPRTQRSFRYEGSLTTPPCAEGVRWFVLETPVQISDAAFAAFEAVLGKNNRPVQPLNDRELLIDGTAAPAQP